MSGIRIYGREILSEFINIYRDNECLWNVKSKDYQNKNVRLRAYKILLKKLKEADKAATIATVKTKINSMRTNFRHELKKIEASKESGAEDEDIYQPTLWYFNDLSFLIGDHVPDLIIKEDKNHKLTDLRSCPRSFILEFINLYRKHECLWNVDSKYYKNKLVNSKAYEALRLKCLEIDKNATIDLVKKKINSMRTNFFAYCKKLDKSKESGLAEDMFQPNLFYFDDMKFLLNRNSEISSKENDTKSGSLKEIKKKRSESSEEYKIKRSESPKENKRKRSESPVEYKLFENVEVEDYFFQSQSNSLLEDDSSSKSNIQNNNCRQKRTRNSSDFEDEKEDVFEVSSNINRRRSKPITKITKYREHYEESVEDEFDVYAKYIASEIRTLSSEDLIFVKKLFNDTLFEAKLGNAKCMRIMSNSKLQMTSEEICFK